MYSRIDLGTSPATLRPSARRARSSARPMRLLIAGGGKDSEVERLRREHGSDQIVFLGHVNPFEFFQQHAKP